MCNYQLRFPNQAPNNSYLYLRAIALHNVDIKVMIAESLTQATVVSCTMQNGDLIAARAPESFFLSVKSTSSGGAKGFLQLYYSEASIESHMNAFRCSTGKNAPGGSDSGGGNNNNNNGGDSGGNTDGGTDNNG